MKISPEDKEVMQALRSSFGLVYKIDNKIYGFKYPAREPEDIGVIITCESNGEYLVDENPVYVLDESTQPIANIDILNQLTLDLPNITMDIDYLMNGRLLIDIPEYEDFDLCIELDMGSITIRDKEYTYPAFIKYLIDCDSRLTLKGNTTKQFQPNEDILGALNSLVSKGILLFNDGVYTKANDSHVMLYTYEDDECNIYADILTRIELDAEYAIAGIDINSSKVDIDYGVITILNPVT